MTPVAASYWRLFVTWVRSVGRPSTRKGPLVIPPLVTVNPVELVRTAIAPAKVAVPPFNCAAVAPAAAAADEMEARF